MFSRILVPLDGSELAERALSPAYTLAQQSEGEVLLLRVPVTENILISAGGPEGVGIPWPDQATEQVRQEALAYLREVQAAAPRPLALRLIPAEGDVAEVIAATAAVEKADLIAISSHGYSGVKRWVLGSVAERVLQGAPCPVLVLRTAQPIRRILVPLDGSALSERALPPAQEVALALDCEVVLLRAVPEVTTPQIERLDAFERGLGLRLASEIREDARAYLDGLAEAGQAAGLEMKTVIAEMPAAESILRYVETHDIDLVAMATHGRSGLKRWVYGSVTDKTLHGGHGSMLIVRPAA